MTSEAGRPSPRMRRVNEALRAVISDAVTELKDPRIGFVTVTDVRASPDLQQATVYVSVLGAERKRASDAGRPRVVPGASPDPRERRAPPEAHPPAAL